MFISCRSLFTVKMMNLLWLLSQSIHFILKQKLPNGMKWSVLYSAIFTLLKGSGGIWLQNHTNRETRYKCSITSLLFSLELEKGAMACVRGNGPLLVGKG